MLLYRASWVVIVASLLTGLHVRDAVAADIPEACEFLTRDDIAEVIGKSIDEGKQEPMPGGASQCTYRTPLSTVTVTTNSSDPAEFEDFRDMIGPEAEAIEGVGDSAYFWGSNLIYVRVGNRGFSLRINDDLGADLRPAMLVLAGQGAAKLQ